MKEHKRVWCIGFGEFEGKCGNKIGGHDSPYWCKRCDDLRIAHISKQLKEMMDSFKRKARK